MSDQEQIFLKAYKRINWSFIIVQFIVLIFYIGYNYSRITKIETDFMDIKLRQELFIKEMQLKADKTDLIIMRKEQMDMIADLKVDLRSINATLMQIKR